MRAIALLALVVAAGPAYAFKEVPVEGAQTAPAPSVAQELVPSAKTPALNLNGNEDAISGANKGTELSIPGVGSLGRLPKLDFGLELLYGATDQELPQNDLDKISPDEDMTIRGTLKHSF